MLQVYCSSAASIGKPQLCGVAMDKRNKTHEAQEKLDDALKDILKVVDEMFEATAPLSPMPEAWQDWCDRYDKAQEVQGEFGVQYISRVFV